MIQKYDNELKQHRLAILTELIGSFAHKIKQPLNVISSSVINLETRSELGALSKNDISKISQNINYGVQNISKDFDIFKELLISSKSKEYMDIVKIIHNLISLLEAQFSQHNIEIKLELPKHFTTEIYPKEFKQMLLGILLNIKNITKKYNKKPENTTKIVLIALNEIDKNISIVYYNTPILENLESKFATIKLIAKEIHRWDLEIFYKDDRDLIFNLILDGRNQK